MVVKRTELRRLTPLKPGNRLLVRKPIGRGKPRTPPKPMKSKPRRLTAHEKRWQQAVLSIGFCVLCGRHGVQWAHRNEGKGAGKKVSPDQSAALCPECHHNIDNGNTLSRHDRRSLMDHAILVTRNALLSLGRLPPPPKAKP